LRRVDISSPKPNHKEADYAPKNKQDGSNYPHMYEIITYSPDQTRLLAQCIGQSIQKGIIIRLKGDLGSGKTCFAQGLAKGLAVPDAYDITSPTYTLIHEYPGRLTLFHIDLYRLEDGFDAEMIGLWEIFDYDAVVAIEWPERLPGNAWPEENLEIDFAITDDHSRKVNLFGYGLAIDNLILEAVNMFDSLKMKCEE